MNHFEYLCYHHYYIFKKCRCFLASDFKKKLFCSVGDFTCTFYNIFGVTVFKTSFIQSFYSINFYLQLFRNQSIDKSYEICLLKNYWTILSYIFYYPKVPNCGNLLFSFFCCNMIHAYQASSC